MDTTDQRIELFDSDNHLFMLAYGTDGQIHLTSKISRTALAEILRKLADHILTEDDQTPGE